MLGAGGRHHEVADELEEPERHHREETLAVPVGREDGEPGDLDDAGRLERGREDQVLLALEGTRRAGRHAHRPDRLARVHVLGEEEPGAAVVLVGDRDLVAARALVDPAADVEGPRDGFGILADAEAVAAQEPGEDRPLPGISSVLHSAPPGRTPKQPLCPGPEARQPC